MWQSVSEGIAQARREMSARIRRDLTNEEIAKAVGVSRAAYSRWEKGERTPNEAAVQRLAKYFGVTPGYLRYGEGESAALPVRGVLSATEIAEARRIRDAEVAAADRLRPKRRRGSQ